MTKALRKGKVFVDWSQNDEHKTTVVRLLAAGARAADRLDAAHLGRGRGGARRRRRPSGSSSTSDAVLARVDEHGDLFAPVLELKQSLPKL